MKYLKILGSMLLLIPLIIIVGTIVQIERLWVVIDIVIAIISIGSSIFLFRYKLPTTNR